MIIYSITTHLRYDDIKGLPMTPADLDVVYSYCPNTSNYYFKRYGLRGLKNLCLTKRGAERRVRRLNKRSGFIGRARICDKCKKVLQCAPDTKMQIYVHPYGDMEYELCSECTKELKTWLSGKGVCRE